MHQIPPTSFDACTVFWGRFLIILNEFKMNRQLNIQSMFELPGNHCIPMQSHSIAVEMIQRISLLLSMFYTEIPIRNVFCGRKELKSIIIWRSAHFTCSTIIIVHQPWHCVYTTSLNMQCMNVETACNSNIHFPYIATINHPNYSFRLSCSSKMHTQTHAHMHALTANTEKPLLFSKKPHMN